MPKLSIYFANIEKCREMTKAAWTPDSRAAFSAIADRWHDLAEKRLCFIAHQKFLAVRPFERTRGRGARHGDSRTPVKGNPPNRRKCSSEGHP